MDILFTWKNYKPLTKGRFDCIEAAKAMYSNSKITVITDLHTSFPDHINIIKLETVRNILINQYKVKPNILNNHYGITDYSRFLYLSIHPNTLYLDTDTFCIKKMPSLKSGLCGAIPNQIDVLFNNNSPETFKKYFNYHRNRPNLMCLSDLFDYEKDFLDVSEYFTHKPSQLDFGRTATRKKDFKKCQKQPI